MSTGGGSSGAAAGATAASRSAAVARRRRLRKVRVMPVISPRCLRDVRPGIVTGLEHVLEVLEARGHDALRHAREDGLRELEEAVRVGLEGHLEPGPGALWREVVCRRPRIVTGASGAR